MDSGKLFAKLQLSSQITRKNKQKPPQKTSVNSNRTPEHQEYPQSPLICNNVLESLCDDRMQNTYERMNE